MKYTRSALKRLLKEAIKNDRIISERPWSVEYTFSMSGSSAEDSEGSSADGFSINMTSDSGVSMRIIVDSYWNPQQGDDSGNSLRVEVDGEEPEGGSSYVPHKFDDGTKQRLVISNTPVAGVITVAHAIDEDSTPIVYLVFSNPFIKDDDDIEFEVEPLGNGDVDVELTNHVNL